MSGVSVSNVWGSKTGWCCWWCNCLGVISWYLTRLQSPALDPPSVQSGPQTINTGIHHIHYTTRHHQTPPDNHSSKTNLPSPYLPTRAVPCFIDTINTVMENIDKALLPRGLPSSLLPPHSPTPPLHWLSSISPENESCKWEPRSCDVMRHGSSITARLMLGCNKKADWHEA